MSKIVYKPHCEKCGAIIDQKVQFKRYTLEGNNDIPRVYVYNLTYYEFYPHQCENCGAVFDSAECQLPEEVTEVLD